VHRTFRLPRRAGITGLEAEFWIGMLAPARTPARLVEKLNTDIVAVLRTPEMQAT
jgi:tripartite-type tricarboxylate transporter receptor subunit TctC